MTIKPEHRVKVGEWWYLPERDKLVKLSPSGQIEATAELDNLCQNVINYLIVRAGDLVTKDELLENVWGIRAVSDGRITRVIRVLRVALGDDSRSPLYIETVPKRGYRLVAKVATEQELAETKQVDETEQSASAPVVVDTPAIARRWLLLGIMLLPVMLAAYFWWFSAHETQEPAVIPLWRYEPVTFLDGIEFYHSISPDEQFLAFSYATSPDDDVVVLKLQDLRNHHIVQLTEAPYSSFGAAWSPDGTQLAYQRLVSGQLCELRVITLTEDRKRVLSNNLLTSCGSQSVSARLSWSPDGRYVVYPSRDSEQNQMSLMMYPIAGEAAEQLTAPPSNGFGDYAARFSRSGDQLVFLRHAAGAVQIWLLELSSRSTRMLIQLNDAMPGQIDWNLDDSEIIYPASRTSLAAISISDGTNRLLAYTNQAARELQITPSGRILASVGAFSQNNILKVPNTIRNSTELEPQRVFSSNRTEAFAVASKQQDGPVAVVSRRSGLPQIWLFYPDGQQKQLTNFATNERVSELVFSPDGRYLFALISQQLWLFNEAGEAELLPLSSESNRGIASLSWSHDSRQLFYAVTYQGHWQVMSRSIDNLAEVTLFGAGMEMYQQSPNGDWVFWRDSSNRRLYLQQRSTGEITQLDVLSEPSSPINFALTDEGIYFSRYRSNNRYLVYFLDFNDWQVRKATSLSATYSNHFSLSADKRYFYLSSMGRGDMDIAEISVEQQNL